MPNITMQPSSSISRVIPFNPLSLRRWRGSVAVWGVGVGVYATYLLSVTPLVKRGFLSKIPILGDYYVDKTPAEDKPF